MEDSPPPPTEAPTGESTTGGSVSATGGISASEGGSVSASERGSGSSNGGGSVSYEIAEVEWIGIGGSNLLVGVKKTKCCWFFSTCHIRNLLCVFPHITTVISPPPLPTSINVFICLRMLLPGIGERCFTLSKGYWTYEFCPGKTARQFHKEVDSFCGGEGGGGSAHARHCDSVTTRFRFSLFCPPPLPPPSVLRHLFPCVPPDVCVLNFVTAPGAPPLS